MAQVGNNENRFGGEYMIQDSDHLSGVKQSGDNRIRQSDQSQSNSRQQGGDRNADRRQANQRRQAQ